MSKAKRLMVTCQHEARSAQAINFVEADSLCLLPLEYLRCMSCAAEWVLDPVRCAMTEHPSTDSLKVIEHYKNVARKSRDEARSAIVKPTAEQVAKLG